MRDAPVHLLGTFHLGPPGGFSLGASFATAFQAAKSLVCEVGPRDKAFHPAILQRESGSLEGDIGSEIYARLRSDPRYDASFEALRPPVVIMNLALRLYTDVGLSPACGVDITLEQQGLANGKSCSGLETFTDQLNAILGIDSAGIARAFHYMIVQPELMHEIRDLVVWSFIGGDEAGIQAARELMGRWSTSFAAKLLTEREKHWLPRIQAIALDNIPTVIAVGALHLAGADGLIGQLATVGIPTDRVDG